MVMIQIDKNNDNIKITQKTETKVSVFLFYMSLFLKNQNIPKNLLFRKEINLKV